MESTSGVAAASTNKKTGSKRPLSNKSAAVRKRKGRQQETPEQRKARLEKSRQYRVKYKQQALSSARGAAAINNDNPAHLSLTRGNNNTVW